MDTFKYTCFNCDAPATKPSVEVLAIKSANAKLKIGPDQGTLGTWRCTGGCRGAVKVRRSRNREEKREVQAKAS